MIRGDRNKDTICAVSTPHGVGGISVIRISGPTSLETTKKICGFLPEKPESHKAYFGVLRNFSTGEELDEVLVTYFLEGKSFTGEEVVEISCHGNPVICQAILQQFVELSVRPADRGEFTFRAFMNGRLDLVQAESVLSLIESQSQKAAKLALRQLKGELSRKLDEVENDMTWVLAHAEAGIDFSTEDIKVVDNSKVIERLARIESVLASLVESYKSGKLVKDGLQVVLTGLPNVGKSSLLNLFLEEDRAIVTDIPGTTRDVVNGELHFGGVRITFFDTAGLRKNASDPVEKIGIQKSKEIASESDIILFVYDCFLGLSVEEKEILNNLDPKQTYILGNKVDKLGLPTNPSSLARELDGSKFLQNIDDVEAFFKRKVFFISALDKSHRAYVLKELVSEIAQVQVEHSILISSARHFDNLKLALENTRRSLAVVQQNLGEEFLALELKEGLIAIQETLGKRFDDQIMDRVFKEFCIGK